jgi:hypothetical protein
VGTGTAVKLCFLLTFSTRQSRQTSQRQAGQRRARLDAGRPEAHQLADVTGVGGSQQHCLERQGAGQPEPESVVRARGEADARQAPWHHSPHDQ